jgi:restriction system protein
MPRRRSRSDLDIWIALIARLPPWLGIFLAGISGAALHILAGSSVVPLTDPSDMGTVMVGSVVKGLATVGQYLVPLVCIAGTASGVFARRRRQQLFSQAVAADAVMEGFDWRQFERLVGGWFEQQGYAVLENHFGGADGGVDLRLRKDGRLYLVQCKHWRLQRVGVGIVRELYGVMAATGADGGFVVASGQFTREAREFAEGRNITLVDGLALQWAFAGLRNEPVANRNFPPEVAPCPRCGATMVRRIAQRGANAGKAFWGCSAFPQCRETRR